MEARLRQALARAEEVARELADPETARNPAKLKQLGREHARLDQIRHTHERLDRLEGELAQAREVRSGEHTSELQSPCNLVCRLLLEKKKTWKKGGDRRSRE